MDYNEYKFTMLEEIQCGGKAAALTAVIAYLFYESWIAGVLIIPVYIILRKRQKSAGVAKQQETLARQFLDVLRTVSSSLMAGLAMENAWREAEKEVEALYGKDSLMTLELKEINQGVALNIPLEQKILELARRSGNEDIMSFAEVFAFAKRSGGNFVTIIKGTENHIRAKYETEREIQVLVAAKRLEQKVMNVVPLFILAYLKISSMGFMDVLYKNLAGVLFMSVCLVLYGFAIGVSEKILSIKV